MAFPLPSSRAPPLLPLFPPAAGSAGGQVAALDVVGPVACLAALPVLTGPPSLQLCRSAAVLASARLGGCAGGAASVLGGPWAVVGGVVRERSEKTRCSFR